MYQLLLVCSILGCLVSTTLVSQAATDATDATSDVSSTPSSQASTNSEGYEFAVHPRLMLTSFTASIVLRVRLAPACFRPRDRRLAVQSVFPQAKVRGHNHQGTTD